MVPGRISRRSASTYGPWRACCLTAYSQVRLRACGWSSNSRTSTRRGRQRTSPSRPPPRRRTFVTRGRQAWNTRDLCPARRPHRELHSGIQHQPRRRKRFQRRSTFAVVSWATIWLPLWSETSLLTGLNRQPSALATMSPYSGKRCGRSSTSTKLLDRLAQNVRTHAKRSI
jgi:hypothetical protein